MRLLIVEKHDFVRKLKDLDLVQPDTEIVYTLGTGFWRFKAPSLVYKDIPFTNQPLEIIPQNIKRLRPMLDINGQCMFGTDKDSSSEVDKQKLTEMVDYIKTKMPEYEEIICMVDVDREGFGAAEQLLTKINTGEMPPVSCMYLSLYTPEAIRSEWKNRKQNLWTESSYAQELADRQLAKMTFDYWWNANSSIVFSELCKKAGVEDSVGLSKYEFMLVCAINEFSMPLGVFDIFQFMQNWKKKNHQKNDYFGRIGSPRSNRDIFDSVIKSGLVDTSKDEYQLLYSVSEKGKKFISMLHPETYDKDLPFKLNEWIESKDYGAMKQYIETVFERQLSYQKNY